MHISAKFRRKIIPIMPSYRSRKIIDTLLGNGRILTLFFLFLIIFGSISLLGLKRQGFPDVAINMAIVRVVYPDANAEQVERDILLPVERTVDGLDDVKEHQSMSFNNLGMVYVTFDESGDVGARVAELRNEVSLLSLPTDVTDVTVEQLSIKEIGDISIAVFGESAEERYVNAEQIKKQLNEIQGVKTIDVVAQVSPTIDVVFNERKLESFEITRTQAEQAILNANSMMPTASFATKDGLQMQVSSKLEMTSLVDLRKIQVAPGVELKDVATVQESYVESDAYNNVGFRDKEHCFCELIIQPATVLNLYIKDDADLLSISDEVDLLLEEVNEDTDTAVLLVNSADDVRMQIDEILWSLFGKPIESLGPFSFLGYALGGLGLVLLFLLLFMNARIALLAALSIPMSLLLTSIVLAVAGVDLNTLVLFSMVLAIGLVVDPTIVFLESFERFRARGMSARDAAAETYTTVGKGVFLAVMTNVLVFVPFGVVSGFFGEIIQYIPITIIPAMLASMVIPVLFFLPFVAVVTRKETKVVGIGEETWTIGIAFGKMIQALLGSGKGRGLARIAVVVLLFTLPVAVGVPLISSGAIEVVQFSSAGDADYLIVNGALPAGWTRDRARIEVVNNVEQILAEQPEIKKFGYMGQGGNNFTLFVTLVPMDQRKHLEMRTSAELDRDLNDVFSSIKDAEIVSTAAYTGPPQSQYPIKLQVFNDDSETLRYATEKIAQFLRAQDGVKQVNSSEEDEDGIANYIYSIDKASGINPFMVAGLVSEQFGERDIGSLELEGVSYRVNTRTGKTLASLKDIENLTVGRQKLGASLSDPEPFSTQTIQRLNGKRYVEISASVEEGVNILVLQSELDAFLTEERLQEWGLSGSAIDSRGDADSITESFTDLFIALGIAIFLIYVLLVGFFRSFVEPFIILFAIPLGLVGVFLAVAFTTGQLGFLELLGVVAMAGVVVNVTILIIDYANQLRQQGYSAQDAISQSIGTRLRPIILTQITAFAGLVPLMFYSPFWKGLAASIIFGIAASAGLSLFLTPILYSWSKKLGDRFQKSK